MNPHRPCPPLGPEHPIDPAPVLQGETERTDDEWHVRQRAEDDARHRRGLERLLRAQREARERRDLDDAERTRR